VHAQRRSHRREHGDVVRFVAGPPGLRATVYAVFHPDAVRRVLQAEADGYRKDNVFYEEVRWALYRTWVRFPWSRRTGYAGFQVPEHAGTTRVVSPRFIGDAHRAGLGVQVWTVNAAADAHRLLDWGVDALITDRPDIMVPLVQARENGNRIAGARV